MEPPGKIKMEYVSYGAVRKMSGLDLRKGIKTMAAKLFAHSPTCSDCYTGPTKFLVRGGTEPAIANTMVYASRRDLSCTSRMVAKFEDLQRRVGDLDDDGDFWHVCEPCQRADAYNENASLSAAESGAGHEALLDDRYHRDNPDE